MTAVSSLCCGGTGWCLAYSTAEGEQRGVSGRRAKACNFLGARVFVGRFLRRREKRGPKRPSAYISPDMPRFLSTLPRSWYALDLPFGLRRWHRRLHQHKHKHDLQACFWPVLCISHFNPVPFFTFLPLTTEGQAPSLHLTSSHPSDSTVQYTCLACPLPRPHDPSPLGRALGTIVLHYPSREPRSL